VDPAIIVANFDERKSAPRLLYIARTSFFEQEKEAMNAE